MVVSIVIVVVIFFLFLFFAFICMLFFRYCIILYFYNVYVSVCEKKKIITTMTAQTTTNTPISRINTYVKYACIRMTLRVATIFTFVRPLHTPFGIFSSFGAFYNYSRSHTYNCEGYKGEITTGWSTQRGNVHTRSNLQRLECVLANEGSSIGDAG